MLILEVRYPDIIQLLVPDANINQYMWWYNKYIMACIVPLEVSTTDATLLKRAHRLLLHFNTALNDLFKCSTDKYGKVLIFFYFIN